MNFLARTSTICAGAHLRSPDGAAEGTLGVLVGNDDGQLFAISVLAVAPAGERPEVRLSTHWESMGLSRPLLDRPATRGEAPVEVLLALIEVNEILQVTPNIPNVGNVSGLVDPLDCINRDFHLAAVPPIRLGPVDAVRTTLFLEDRDNDFLSYKGAVALSLAESLPAGIAGSLVTTAFGEILGIAVAADPDRLYVAPLKSALAGRGLHVLAFDGGQHNAIALELLAERDRQAREAARETERQARLPYQRLSDSLDSEAIFKKYDLEKMAKMKKAA